MKLNKRFIFFEGTDASGKTAIRKKYSELTNNEYLVFDRLPSASGWVFAKFFKRDYDLNRYFEIDRDLQRYFDSIFIYVFADVDVIIERQKKKDEYIYNREEIIKVQSLYEEYIKLSGYKTIRINTTNLEVEDAAKIVIERVKEFLIKERPYNIL